MKKFLSLIWIFFFATIPLQSQNLIAITIDDIPNTKQYEKDNFQGIFLNKLDSIKIPVTIFINEGLIYKTDSIDKNFSLLHEWIKRDYVIPGNHTFSHSRYSEMGFESFSNDVVKGEIITKELAQKYKKTLKYFRFPFNDLGKDSIQHIQMTKFLISQNYIITPYTFESSDWMFNFLYEYYLEKDQKEKAKHIAQTYIDKTLESFDFFREVTQKQYGRNVNQIYLCHDNRLNADYIHVIIQRLINKGYSFASLEKILEDKIYSQSDLYNKKWGISWIYRWMPDHKERIKLMKQEPELSEYYELYKKLTDASESKSK